MMGPPPDFLSASEQGRLELVLLPAPEGMEETAVYRLEDTGEFVTEDQEEADAIRTAFPDARVRMN